MKIEVQREALAAIMKDLAPFNIVEIDPRDIEAKIKKTPVMVEFNGNVMTMKVLGDGLVIQRAIEVNIVEGEEDFVDVVNAIGLHSILTKKSLGKTVSCDFQRSNDVLLIHGKTKYSLPLMDSKWFSGIEFPSKPEGAPTVLSADLRRLISTVAFAMDKKKRYELRGVHIHTDGDKLVAVATNGVVLARYAIKRPDFLDLEEGVTIPKPAIEPLIRFLLDAGDQFTVQMDLSHGRFALWSGHSMVGTVLVDKKFPEYKRLLSEEPSLVSVDYQELHNSIELCLSTANKFVVVRKIEGEDGLAVESWNPFGANTRTFIERLEDEATLPAPVFFNARYMQDCLTMEVGVDFGDGNKPIRIKGGFDTEFEALINPMKVSDIDMDAVR